MLIKRNLRLSNFGVQVDGANILSDVCLSFGPGIHVIMGKNGVGKSSLAQSLIGNPKFQTTGKIEINNNGVYNSAMLEIQNQPTQFRSGCGLFVGFQTPVPIKGVSNFRFLKEAMRAHMSFCSRDPASREVVGLLHNMKVYCKQLGLPEEWPNRDLNVNVSGGEFKKNEIIQMLLMQQRVSILDEPDSGLDVDAINTLIKLLRDVKEKTERTIIIISHYEKLIKNLPIESYVLLENQTARNIDELTAYKILKDGYGVS